MTSHDSRNTPNPQTQSRIHRDNVRACSRISPIEPKAPCVAPSTRRARDRRATRAKNTYYSSRHTARWIPSRRPPTDVTHDARRRSNFPLLRAIERSRAIATSIEHRTPRETTARRTDGRDDYKNTVRTWTLVALKAATRPTKEEARRADIVLVCRNGDGRAGEIDLGRARRA